MWIYIFAIFVILISYCVINFHQTKNYWKKKGVKYVKPKFFVGNMLPIITQKIPMAEYTRVLYSKFPNERYYGIFNFTRPILVVKDLDLIRDMAIKNFEHFVDHTPFISPEADALWGKNLFASNGQHWRNLRQTMSPVFTSSKMKMMYILMEECAKEFVNYFKKHEYIEVEMKETFSKLASDVIASTSFGVQCNSLKNPNNEILKCGREISDIQGLKSLKFLCYGVFPKITKWFGLKIITKNAGKFFSDIISQAIQLRESNQVNRPDLIQLLVQARQGKFKEEEDALKKSMFEGEQDSKSKESKHVFLTDEDIIAQGIVFYFGGYDTTSYLLSFTSLALAAYPDIQSKLRNEILKAFEENNGKVDYNIIMKIKYLDMVISEVLRLWPPAMWLDRKCTKSFEIEPKLKGETTIKIGKGETIWFPVYAIHTDPQYHPDPYKFDPERFSDENSDNIIPYTYMPFGTGPRNCIGSRFALLEAKTVFVYLLKDFEIIPTTKTVLPIKLSKTSFFLSAEGLFHVGLKRIAA